MNRIQFEQETKNRKALDTLLEKFKDYQRKWETEQEVRETLYNTSAKADQAQRYFETTISQIGTKIAHQERHIEQLLMEIEKAKQKIEDMKMSKTLMEEKAEASKRKHLMGFRNKAQIKIDKEIQDLIIKPLLEMDIGAILHRDPWDYLEEHYYELVARLDSDQRKELMRKQKPALAPAPKPALKPTPAVRAIKDTPRVVPVSPVVAEEEEINLDDEDDDEKPAPKPVPTTRFPYVLKDGAPEFVKSAFAECKDDAERWAKYNEMDELKVMGMWVDGSTKSVTKQSGPKIITSTTTRRT